MRSPLHAQRLVAALFAASLVVCGGVARSDDAASVPELKGAFVLNFARFTVWPATALPPGAPLQVCVADDAVVARVLERLAHGNDVDGHAIAVRRVGTDHVQGCHVLYAPGRDAGKLTGLLAGVKGGAVLTVGDVESFAQSGGIMYLFEQNGRMRFGVNVDAAHRAHLQLSSKLLSLAQIVKDDATATR